MVRWLLGHQGPRAGGAGGRCRTGRGADGPMPPGGQASAGPQPGTGEETPRHSRRRGPSTARGPPRRMVSRAAGRTEEETGEAFPALPGARCPEVSGRPVPFSTWRKSTAREPVRTTPCPPCSPTTTAPTTPTAARCSTSWSGCRPSPGCSWPIKVSHQGRGDFLRASETSQTQEENSVCSSNTILPRNSTVSHIVLQMFQILASN